MLPHIIEETPDFIVLEKPAGLIVHATPGHEGPALTDFLIKKYPEIKGVGEGEDRPGIVHRLDKDVSGLMVVARTQDAFMHLKSQFQTRAVKKIYTALVIGKLPKDEGVIDFPIARSFRRPRMAAVPKSTERTDARDAITRYEVVKRFPNATLVRVEIETGRTNQIRAHFHALGYPIAGDARYMIKSKKMRGAPTRPFLHATMLSFRDRNGEFRTYKSELPNDLKKCL